MEANERVFSESQVLNSENFYSFQLSNDVSIKIPNSLSINSTSPESWIFNNVFFDQEISISKIEVESGSSFSLSEYAQNNILQLLGEESEFQVVKLSLESDIAAFLAVGEHSSNESIEGRHYRIGYYKVGDVMYCINTNTLIRRKHLFLDNSKIVLQSMSVSGL